MKYQLDQVRATYEARWKKLYEQIDRRNKLLETLAQLTEPAAGLSLATGMFYEFDAERARALITEIVEITPAILAEIAELNGLGKQLGKAEISIYKGSAAGQH